MAEQKFDLVVIGAGPAGSEAATNAAKDNVRVALVEKHKLGGTCLNYGCDPTDTLLHVAHMLYSAQNCNPYGLNVPKANADWNTVQGFVQKVMKQIRGGTDQQARQRLKEQGIQFFQGSARFLSPNQVAVGNKTLRAERIILATGVNVVVPPIEGLKETGYITHVQAVALPELPRRLAIIGSVPMAIEFAQLFQRFGVEVTVLEHGSLLLEGEDREVADRLIETLTDEGIRFETEVEFERVEQLKSGKRIHLSVAEGPLEKLLVDEILIMLPRRPLLEPLQLDAAGVEYTDKGITVDATLRTTAPHIWAAGDVTGGPQFSNRASEQGKLAAQNAFTKEPERFEEPLIPWIISTDPALTHIGKTEEQLWKEGTEYTVARMPLEKIDRAIMSGETQGLVKLLVDKDGMILGGHILAREAGDMLAPIAVAMRAGLPVKTLAETILPYPTMAEAVRWAADGIVASR